MHEKGFDNMIFDKLNAIGVLKKRPVPFIPSASKKG